MKVDTHSAAARAQFDANADFALSYRAQSVCRPGRRRVLVTGFGRFLGNASNATGHIVSRLVPSTVYPETARPPKGEVDLPGPQTSVSQSTLQLSRAGEVDVCAMVLPVYWGLAAIVTLKEIEAFAPDVVLMTGIAGPTQDVWIELGSVNRALGLRDGSDLLTPSRRRGDTRSPVVPGARPYDRVRGMLWSWEPVRDAMRAELARHAAVVEAGVRLDAVVHGVKLAGFPRAGNAYLCNNITYAVNYAMAHPGRALTLLQASDPRRGAVNRVQVTLQRDARAVPRTFMHWPSMLAGAHLDAAAELMRAALDAQLVALDDPAQAPTVGTNALAELAASGATF